MDPPDPGIERHPLGGRFDDGRGQHMALQKRWSHESRFVPEMQSARAARDFVTLHLVNHELAYLADDVRLVTSELASNAAVHARSPFVVRLESLPLCVRVSVQDDIAAEPFVRVTQVHESSGRGLAVVERFSTAWGIVRTPTGGKSVWASFALRTAR